jgi:hypothetical protein
MKLNRRLNSNFHKNSSFLILFQQIKSKRNIHRYNMTLTIKKYRISFNFQKYYIFIFLHILRKHISHN